MGIQGNRGWKIVNLDYNGKHFFHDTFLQRPLDLYVASKMRSHFIANESHFGRQVTSTKSIVRTTFIYRRGTKMIVRKPNQINGANMRRFYMDSAITDIVSPITMLYIL